MDDLISRQAAIDALDKIFPADPMRNDYTQGITCGAALATEYIKQLSSAQPEIIHCKDCEWWEKQKDSLQGRCELMQMYPTGAWYCGNARRRVTDD